MMKIVNIEEHGCNSILRWALANGAKIKDDWALQNLINDETFYMITVEGINFLELFRLTQLYRDKLHLISSELAECPSDSELEYYFPGELTVKTANNQEETVNRVDVSKAAITKWINLVRQMQGDDDIITHNAVGMFLPMISRKHRVSFPIAFIDFVNAMDDKECEKFFNENYKENIKSIIDDNEHSINRMIYTCFMKYTTILKAGQKNDKFLKITKYAPLNTVDHSKLYRINLLTMYKFDNVDRSQIRCSLFNVDKDNMANTLKRIGNLRTPLQLEFAVELPIQYMQMLANSFDNETLEIKYESSMADIIDYGLNFNDYIASEFSEDSEDEDERNKFTEHEEAISAYRARIAECNEITLKTIPLVLSDDSDTTAAFSMLPSIYTSRAIIKINLDNASKYTSHYDPIIVSMFKDMLNMANNVVNDISK